MLRTVKLARLFILSNPTTKVSLAYVKFKIKTWAQNQQ